MYSHSASASASDLLLATIAAISLALALLALFQLLLLLVMRPLRERWQRRAVVRRERIRLMLNRTLASPYNMAAEDMRRFSRQSPEDVIAVAAETLRNLRGADERRLAALLQQCDMLAALQRSARRGSRADRIRAITVLAHFPKESAAGTLIGQVLAFDPDITLAALRGLAAIGAPPAFKDVLLLLFARGRNLPLIADTMQRFGEAAVADLKHLAQHPVLSLPGRIAAIQALTAIGTPECVDAVLSLTDDPRPFLRAEAVAALARISDPRTVPAILAALDDGDQGVRLAAVRVCAALRLSAAAPRLARMILSDTWWIRFWAAQAFWSFGEPGMAVLRQVSREEGEHGLAHQILAEKGVAP